MQEIRHTSLVVWIAFIKRYSLLLTPIFENGALDHHRLEHRTQTKCFRQAVPKKDPCEYCICSKWQPTTNHVRFYNKKKGRKNPAKPCNTQQANIYTLVLDHNIFKLYFNVQYFQQQWQYHIQRLNTIIFLFFCRELIHIFLDYTPPFNYLWKMFH